MVEELKDKIAALEDEELRAILELLLERIEELESRLSAPPIRMGLQPNANR